MHGHNWGLYAWCFAGACGLAAWGVYESRIERINLGIAGVAVTLLFFFFTNFADKLTRSLSLVALGCLFLIGGWLLEKTRRLLAGRALEG
jgi:HAMP domain-containing protein